MRLSIVVPYFNRRQLLMNVLKSIDKYISGDVELIIIDDGSNKQNQVYDFKNLFPLLKINLVVLPRHDKWQNPCIAYNTGFNIATGDVILLNSSEVVHVGDIIGYIFKYFIPKTYMCFATCMQDTKGDWWGVHSSIGNFIPYCAAINREDLEILSGYDERFATSMGFDDYDFTRRVYTLGLKMICVDDPYCMHQYHKPTVYNNTINKDLLDYLDRNFPDRIKADANKIYVR